MLLRTPQQIVYMAGGFPARMAETFEVTIDQVRNPRFKKRLLDNSTFDQLHGDHDQAGANAKFFSYHGHRELMYALAKFFRITWPFDKVLGYDRQGIPSATTLARHRAASARPKPPRGGRT